MMENVTLNEAATLLGVSKATLRNWDRQGKLSAKRHPLNRYRMYDLAEVRQLQSQIGLFPDDFLSPVRPAKAESLDLRSARKLVSKLHSVLRNTDSQSNIISRFDEITKLLFTKSILSRPLPPNAASVNWPTAKVSASQIRDCYQALARQYTAIIPARFSTLDCSDQAIEQSAELLNCYDFAAARFDVKGIAYEEVIRNTFDKGDHQQFFTPPQIVDFMVDACRPFIRGAVCDPAAGTGGFLACIARKNLSYDSLTALEIDERLAWVSGMNLLLHEGRNIDTVVLPDGGSLGAAAKRFHGTFDAIITNPPFGSDFTDRQALADFRLGVGRSSRRRGILFVERCHDLLKNGGVLAIIIDEGVLNLSHATDVRDFVTKHFNLLAVIGLPETAFMPYANVNASILILSKRHGRNKQKPVFFAKAEAVGRKPNGDDDIGYNREGGCSINSDLPAILRAWQKHLEGSSVELSPKWFVADVSGNIASDDNSKRLDFQYHHPSRQISRELLEKCPFTLLRLGEICTDKSRTMIPSQELSDTVIPYTGLAHIEAGTGRAVQEPTPANSLKSAVKEYNPGDIVFAKMRPNLRKVALMDFVEAGYVSPECSVFEVNVGADGKPLLDPLLLSVLLRSDFVFGQILHLVGGIGRPRIKGSELRQVLIPVPDVTIQQQIKEHYNGHQEEARRMQAQAEKMLLKAQEILTGSVSRLAGAFAGKEDTK